MFNIILCRVKNKTLILLFIKSVCQIDDGGLHKWYYAPEQISLLMMEMFKIKALDTSWHAAMKLGDYLKSPLGSSGDCY